MTRQPTQLQKLQATLVSFSSDADEVRWLSTRASVQQPIGFLVGLVNSADASEASSESRSAPEALLSFSPVAPEMVSPVSH